MSPSHKVIVRKLLRSPWAKDPEPSITEFSNSDQTSVAIATARATFFQDVQIDVGALEEALTIVLEDLPFLSGR
jgi:hypothetical protein